MVKRILALLALVLSASPAQAAFPQPPNVPAYVAQTVHYAGPGQVYQAPTGQPPAYSSMPANIVAPNENQWLLCSVSGTYPSCAASSGYTVTGERKFRTQFMTTHILNDDPVRNYGQPGTAHCHLFWGNRSTNAYSTYQTLRARPRSRSAGGPINASGYWAPCFVLTNPNGDGKNYAMRSTLITGYYENWLKDQSQVFLPRNFSFVSGFNMDDPDDVALDAEVAAANTGQSGRYIRFVNPDGFVDKGVHWECISGVDQSSTNATQLIKSDGTDGFLTGWGSTAALTYHQHCGANDDLMVTFTGPQCWDGVNPWSPGGYSHVRRTLFDTYHSNAPVCPDNWYHIPQLVEKMHFKTNGWAGATGYSSFKSSSDAAAAAKAGHAIAPMASLHFDYMFGWDDTIFRTAMANCAGSAATPQTSTLGNDCSGSSISDTVKLLADSPAPDGSSGSTNVIDYSFVSSTTVPATMFLLPSGNYTGLRSYTTH